MIKIFRSGLLAFLVVILPFDTFAQMNFNVEDDDDKWFAFPWAAYDKANGLTLGATRVKYQFTPTFVARGKIGWTFENEELYYLGSLEKSIQGESSEYLVSASYFNASVTNDAAVLPEWQNSLAALIFQSDFYNHYKQRGARLTVENNLQNKYRYKFSVATLEYESLVNRTNYSFFDWGAEEFGGEKEFEPNPPVEEGRDNVLSLSYVIDLRKSKNFPLNDWYFDGEFDHSGLLAGDFDYSRAQLHFRRYQRLTILQRFVASFTIGSHSGGDSFKETFTTATGDSVVKLPSDQFLYDLGGIGSLRGYDHHEFRDGNRMMLFRFDYFFGGTLMQKIPLYKIPYFGRFYRTLGLVLFADAGYLWNNNKDANLFDFRKLEYDEIKSDIGFSIAAMQELARFDVAFPLADGGTDLTGRQLSERGDIKLTFRFLYKL